jgi:hypothetical protein
VTDDGKISTRYLRQVIVVMCDHKQRLKIQKFPVSLMNLSWTSNLGLLDIMRHDFTGLSLSVKLPYVIESHIIQRNVYYNALASQHTSAFDVGHHVLQRHFHFITPRKNSHTQTHSHKHSHKHTHTHTQTHLHTLTYTYTHTHTLTHVGARAKTSCVIPKVHRMP